MSKFDQALADVAKRLAHVDQRRAAAVARRLLRLGVTVDADTVAVVLSYQDNHLIRAATDEPVELESTTESDTAEDTEAPAPTDEPVESAPAPSKKRRRASKED